MLDRVVTEAAGRHGSRVAWAMADDPSASVTFADLPDVVGRLAGGLSARGVREGDVVALVLQPGLAYPLLYLAAARLGAATAGVNHRLSVAERRALVDRVRPRVVVAGPGLDDGLDGAVLVDAATPDALVAALGPGASFDEVAADPERPVAICFTSGTTGRPKAAVFAARQLDAITTIDTGWRWGAGGAGIMATSFAHLGPMTKLPGTLVRGTTTHVMRRWSATDYLDVVEREAVATVAGVPTQVAMLLDTPALADRDLSSVRLVVVGGGPATPALLRRASEAFGAPVVVRYSCTEAGIGLGTAPDDPPWVAEQTVGRPHRGVDVRIDPIEGSEPVERSEPVGRSEPVEGVDAPVGEVVLRSPAAMSGYLDDPDATAEAFTADGWVRTGDLGRLGADGRVRLAGRRDDRWVRGGHNVHPMEVEAVLVDHPAVRDVAVVGVDDDVFGQVGAAFVVPVPGCDTTLDDLRAFARERLATHKLPERLVVVDALPLTPGNKVDRRALARQATEPKVPHQG